ncbi:hypothetical protein EMIT0P258_40356 [Pseudomonas sp. IT-P258]
MLRNTMVFYIKKPHLFARFTYLACHPQRIFAVYEWRNINDRDFSEGSLFAGQTNIK